MQEVKLLEKALSLTQSSFDFSGSLSPRQLVRPIYCHIVVEKTKLWSVRSRAGTQAFHVTFRVHLSPASSQGPVDRIPHLE